MTSKANDYLKEVGVPYWLAIISAAYRKPNWLHNFQLTRKYPNNNDPKSKILSTWEHKTSDQVLKTRNYSWNQQANRC